MKSIRSRRGEVYLDTCLGLLVLVMVLVFFLNVFSFLSLKQHMEEVSTQLMEVAAYTGGFGEEFQQMVEELESQYGYTVQTQAERYFDASRGQVQLGDVMMVQVTSVTRLQGFGAAVEIPITATVRKSGISETYWK